MLVQTDFQFIILYRTYFTRGYKFFMLCKQVVAFYCNPPCTKPPFLASLVSSRKIRFTIQTSIILKVNTYRLSLATVVYHKRRSVRRC